MKLMFLILCLFILRPSFAKQSCYLKENSRVKAKVIKVSDGDTAKIILTDKRLLVENPDCYLYRKNVRLLYIDTPETHFEFGGVKHSQGHWGEVASKTLKNRLPPNTEVELVFGLRPQDAYGRFLAEIYFENKNLNLEMVRSGLAFPIFFFPQLENAWAYLEANLSAREAEIGIFSDHEASQLTPREFRNHHSGRTEGMLVGNIMTGEVFSGEDYREVPAAFRVFGRDYSEMIKVLNRYKNKAPKKCWDLLAG